MNSETRKLEEDIVLHVECDVGEDEHNWRAILKQCCKALAIIPITHPARLPTIEEEEDMGEDNAQRQSPDNKTSATKGCTSLFDVTGQSNLSSQMPVAA